MFIKLQLLKIIINICRVFSDIIEKYLFEFNSVSPFKLLFIKGISQTLYIGIFYLFNSNNEFSNSKKNELETWKIIIFIIFLIIYFVISGFNSIYKIFTVKMYSSMTRTLFDSVLDIGFYLYFSISKEKNSKKGIKSEYFWINLVGQFIVIFFNLVYNEFLVLNLCGLEKETHKEITKRALTVELNDAMSESTDNNDQEDIINASF